MSFCIKPNCHKPRPWELKSPTHNKSRHASPPSCLAHLRLRNTQRAHKPHWSRFAVLGIPKSERQQLGVFRRFYPNVMLVGDLSSSPSCNLALSDYCYSLQTAIQRGKYVQNQDHSQIKAKVPPLLNPDDAETTLQPQLGTKYSRAPPCLALLIQFTHTRTPSKAQSHTFSLDAKYLLDSTFAHITRPQPKDRAHNLWLKRPPPPQRPAPFSLGPASPSPKDARRLGVTSVNARRGNTVGQRSSQSGAGLTLLDLTKSQQRNSEPRVHPHPSSAAATFFADPRHVQRIRIFLYSGLLQSVNRHRIK
ncbi:hypothetical protein HBI82_094080 [Parastagonospora nodorum]|nr:hypothetical protein HBI74_018810 [Parastagonospora nodorum]KAH6019650.1 hypothetical protein HBI82_094080 [Parastagonospora nodorum]